MIDYCWKPGRYIINFRNKELYAKFFGFVKVKKDTCPNDFVNLYDLKEAISDTEPVAHQIFDLTYGWDVKDLEKYEVLVLANSIRVSLIEPKCKGE